MKVFRDIYALKYMEYFSLKNSDFSLAVISIFKGSNEGINFSIAPPPPPGALVYWYTEIKQNKLFYFNSWK